jgi:hypothetical protein
LLALVLSLVLAAALFALLLLLALALLLVALGLSAVLLILLAIGPALALPLPLPTLGLSTAERILGIGGALGVLVLVLCHESLLVMRAREIAGNASNVVGATPSSLWDAGAPAVGQPVTAAA